MRFEVVEKRMVSIQNLTRQGKRINGLYRLLACPAIWEQAYEDIASNRGALTPGVDPENTLDGFSLERVNRIISAVMDGTYRFSPVRRHYIPKPDGRKRPLGIPTADDKLVQAAVKILLECIYEPVFSDRSHGFRKGHSCHTALEQIRYGWSGTKWLVEVDVSGFFDNVDHTILLDLLRKRIDDERFLKLIDRMLKAGYMEDWTFHKTFSGTPQGGVISPILANVYLHELDEYMREMKATFEKGKVRRKNPAWQVFSRQINNRSAKIKRRRLSGDESEIPTLLAEIKALRKERRNVSYSDWFDPNYRRLLYCRYADDFLIGIIGSKADARDLMQNVQNFLKVRLKLDTSPEKSGVRKASEGTMFLGYTVRTHTGSRAQRIVCGGRSVVANIASDRMQLHAPKNKLAKYAERHRLGSYHTNRGSMRPEFCNHSDVEIIARYNALMRGIAEYYKLGTSWRNEVSRLYHVWWRSLINSLAHKYKCSAPKIIQRLRHGNEYGVWYESRTGKRFWPVFALKHVNAAYLPRRNVDDLPILFVGERTDLMDRLHAATCEACGAEGVPVEIHHARRLKDAQHLSLQVRVKAARTRKRVVLCVPCHQAHHAGRLQGRLDSMNASIGAG